MELVGLIAGILLGVISGLTPGIHVNTITALVLALSVSLSSFGVDFMTLLAFVSALAITHTFFDVIPGLFLGVPGDDVYVMLPGHRLVKSGFGKRATKLSVMGSLLGLALGLALITVFMVTNKLFGLNIVGTVEGIISEYMFWILLVVSGILIFSDRGKAGAFVTFLTSGLLGVLILGSPIIPGGTDASINALFPSLAGLFGVAGLIFAIATFTTPSQSSVREELPSSINRSDLIKPVTRGSLAGGLVGLLPGLGSANAATMLLVLEEWLSKRKGKNVNNASADESYLVTTSSLNTVEALFSIAALVLISKSRSGASIAVDQILRGSIYFLDLMVICVFVAVAGAVSAAIMWRASDQLSAFISRLSDIGLNVAVLTFLFSITSILMGLSGVYILVIASVVGLLPMFLQARRAQLMGFFLVPTMLFYSGVGPQLYSMLELSAQNSPSANSIDITGIFAAIMISIVAMLASYRLSRADARISPLKYSTVVAIVILIGVMTHHGFVSEKIKTDTATAPESSNETIRTGKLERVIDGDTLVIDHAARRIRIRLSEIDAPESLQAFGLTATEFLINEINLMDQSVVFTVDGIDRYGRVLATLFDQDKQRINEKLVADGLAWVYMCHARCVEYKTAEDEAYRARLGLWSDPQPIRPADWRKKR